MVKARGTVEAKDFTNIRQPLKERLINAGHDLIIRKIIPADDGQVLVIPDLAMWVPEEFPD